MVLRNRSFKVSLLMFIYSVPAILFVLVAYWARF